MPEKKIKLEEIYKSVIMTTNHGDFTTISKDSIFKFAHEACKQLLELAAENALEVDYIERSMDKDVYSQILNTIKQVE